MAGGTDGAVGAVAALKETATERVRIGDGAAGKSVVSSAPESSSWESGVIGETGGREPGHSVTGDDCSESKARSGSTAGAGTLSVTGSKGGA